MLKSLPYGANKTSISLERERKEKINSGRQCSDLLLPFEKIYIFFFLQPYHFILKLIYFCGDLHPLLEYNVCRQ